MNIQSAIRKLELNESTVSTVLGSMVLLIVAVLMYGYFSNRQTSVQPTAETAPTPIPGQIQTGETSSAMVSRYTVAQGDYLWKIAKDHYGTGYAWPQLAKVNNLTPPYILSPGQEINLPRVEDLDLPAFVADQITQDQPQVSPDTSTTQSPATPSQYTTAQGDNLWKIAQDHYGDGYAWTRIWQANRDIISDPNLLLVGQQLTLP